MDVNLNAKRPKTRKRKRHSKIKRREQARLEVRFAKRRKLVAGERNVYVSVKSKEKLTNAMQANTFWENYKAAHEWQQRHSVEWWKSRCVALEHENVILRDKIRELTSNSIRHGVNDSSVKQGRRRGARTESLRRSSRNRGDDEWQEQEETSDNDNLEFQVDEDMMKFFEQTIRHKIELKEKRDVESAREKAELEEEVPMEGGAAWMRTKLEGAKLLYGTASPRILAMETALQATNDRHKDRAKPQYWPNIPLKL
ncbi:gem-associated protein 8-like [Neodiprion virginianus]|uniref:gem-associated protein 8-like n=1 Tax=Neodiprion virginianus TaxID=2961670 RepID=UPI001EE6B3D7|nr:gem-associated protein 8-like [Neodiprion virginianus]